jgi:hypothetical protein
MNWVNILIAEAVIAVVALYGLGILKTPRFLLRRTLMKGFPWGYYADQVPENDPGYVQRQDARDFMHDLGTEFGGLEVFGDYGEFSGFGELGEFGSSFFGGGE